MKSTAKDDKNVKLRLWIYENVMSLNFVWKFWHQFIESAKITPGYFLVTKLSSLTSQWGLDFGL